MLQSEAEGVAILLSRLKEIINEKSHYYTVHAQEQMAVRRILDAEVRQAISGDKAEIIATIYEPDLEKWREDLKTRRH